MANGPDIPTQRATVMTPDGVSLGATFVPAKTLKAPAVLLLHMLGLDRTSFAPLLAPLRDAGIATLSIDFRGHGASTKRGSQLLNWEQFGPAEWQGLLVDTETALEALRKRRGVDPSRIAIVGASIGANAALRMTTADQNVRAVVLLSPGLDYRGLTMADAGTTLGNRPALIISAEGDTYSHDSSTQVGKTLAGATVVTVPGDAHGTNLFAADPTVLQRVVTFLHTSLTT
jgi:pimeloyl-ACP methyl ester carboxylesterase